MQFEIGISTSRHFPARGTAGLARSFVSGNSRVPAPPPMITARMRLVLGVSFELLGVCAIGGLVPKRARGARSRASFCEPGCHPRSILAARGASAAAFDRRVHPRQGYTDRRSAID